MMRKRTLRWQKQNKNIVTSGKAMPHSDHASHKQQSACCPETQEDAYTTIKTAKTHKKRSMQASSAAAKRRGKGLHKQQRKQKKQK
mmetsp:Transcript_60905/g.133272  ORF Transcript_60905/g.133272 Transcript_60905/m.133272 type:complete len:86 (+) Transcript_60905:121-378(+)